MPPEAPSQITVLLKAWSGRGYLQHWLRNDEIPEQSAQRIITTAQRILAAGNQDPTSAGASSTERSGVA